MMERWRPTQIQIKRAVEAVVENLPLISNYSS